MGADIARETLTVLSLLVAGSAFVRSVPDHDHQGRLAVLAWCTAYGAGTTIIAFAATSVLRINRPSVVLLPPLLALAVAVIRRGFSIGAGHVVRDLPGLLALSTVVVAAARMLRLGNYTPDSFQLIAGARTMAENRRTTAALASPLNFEEFPPGYSLLQIPSAWGDHAANHGLGVLLAVSLLALLGHALHSTRRPISTLTITSILGLLTATHFFWAMTTYVNSHAVVALLLLATFLRLSAGRGILLDDLPMLLMVASLVLLRVENVLLVALLLVTRTGLGEVYDPARTRTVRAALAVAGVTGLAHQGTVIAIYGAAEQAPSSSSLGLIGVSAVLVLVAVSAPLLLRTRLLPTRLAVPVLLGLNLVYAVLDRQGFIASLLATIHNLFFWRGGWGILPHLVLGLMVSAVILRRLKGVFAHDESMAVFEFLLAAALLLFFTGFLRELPFRAGGWDSLNRQLFHLLPLALLAVGQAMGQTHRPLPSDEFSQFESEASGRDKA
jgi:hypothetical protein